MARRFSEIAGPCEIVPTTYEGFRSGLVEVGLYGGLDGT